MKRKRREPEPRPMLTEDFNAVVQWLRWLYEAADRAVTAWINKPRIGDTRPGSKVVSFKPRDHFRADGTVKTRRTLANAQQWCQTYEGYRFYKCTVCQAYHVGHRVALRKAS